VERASERRPFTLSNVAGDSYHLGVLDPNVTVLPCTGYARLDVRVSIRRLPHNSKVRLSLVGEEDVSWDLRLSDHELAKPVLLNVSHGRYQLAIEAPHFGRFIKAVQIGEPPQTIAVDLKPLPVLEGSIIDRVTHRPVGGALIRTDVQTEAVADSAGRFTIEADPENWPKTITASAGGYAENTSVPPAARLSTILDPILLSRGGRIAVGLKCAPTQVLSLELRQVAKRGRSLGAIVQTLPVPRKISTSSLIFESVDPGEYVILAAGEQDYERFGEPVTVETGQEVKLNLCIVPFQVRLQTRMDGEPLGGSRVTLRNRDVHWSGVFTTDTAGEKTIELWQGGRLEAVLLESTEKPGGLMPYLERRTLTDGEEAEWLLEIPRREVSGTVVDAKSGAPVPNAAVALQMNADDGYSLSVKTSATEDGFFRFSPVAYGQHVLKAAAAGYPPITTSYSFHEPEHGRVMTIRLEAAKATQLTISDGRGVPLVGARVFEFTGFVNRFTGGFTDEFGTIRILVAEQNPVDVYVVPRDGSLGFVQLQPGTERSSLRIQDGISRITLYTESDSHVPIPDVQVVLRYNGRVLPVELIQALGEIQGSRIRSDLQGRMVFDHMPLGLYEFWPAGSQAELRALAAGVGPQAPVSMVAVPGENTATLTFAAVTP
jgi:hypothetical protein